MPSYRLERNLTGILDPREMCYQCLRPASHCLCGLVTQFTAHCNFLILQHPHERKKYHSTSRLVTKAIKNSQILHGVTFDEQLVTKTLQGKNPYLLYPGHNAFDCQEININQDSTVIVIDGTWVEARKIVYRNKFLQQIPKVSFKLPLRSKYKIRKQPKDFCLSTLECIGHLLKLSVAETDKDRLADYESLFTAFDTMVDRQIQYFPRMLNSQKPEG